MASAKNPAKALFSSFRGLGLSAPQVRHFAPDWWNDEAAMDEGGLLELQILLARRLHVSLESLQTTTPEPQLREATRRFKTVHPDGSSQLAIAAGVGYGLAQVLASACLALPAIELIAAQELRTKILTSAKATTLDALCRWLWTSGIPTVHIMNWPKQLRRPDAMCVRIGNRPVILVVRHEAAAARLAYLVAHEVGHIMSGHLRSDSNAVLVDDTLPVDKQGFATDEDEKTADQYAMELLGGRVLLQACMSIGPQSSEVKLAVAALQASKGNGLDAGQVILGWARNTQDWQTAGLAMRYLMTSQPAPVMMNDIATGYLDRDSLSADGQDHITRLTGMEFNQE
jgi:hypothetical protein